MSYAHAAVGSYAVDAMTQIERAEFEMHLLDCASCQAEVSEYADTLGELSLLLATPPPAALRQRVLTAVAGVAQAGPQRATWSTPTPTELEEDDGLERAPRRALAPVTELRPVEPHEVAPLEEHPSVVPDTPWLGMAAALNEDFDRRSRRREHVLGAIIAALVVVALLLGGWVYASRQQLAAQEAKERQGIELLTAPDMVRKVATSGHARITFVSSEQRNQVMVVGNNLPAPAPGSVYQLWGLRGPAATATAMSIGVLAEGGDIRQLFTGLPDGAERLALTLEPTPVGSPKPIGSRLFEVDLQKKN